MVLSISAAIAKERFVEFSTSMSFDEFAVVVRYLKERDPEFGSEVGQAVASFKQTSQPGHAVQAELESVYGIIVLEREDSHTLGIATFTDEESNSKIEQAYKYAIEELGI